MRTEMNTEMRELTIEETDAVNGGEMTSPKIDWRPSPDTVNLSKAIETLWNAVTKWFG